MPRLVSTFGIFRVQTKNLAKMKTSNKDLIITCIDNDADNELITLKERLQLCECDMCKRGVELIGNYFKAKEYFQKQAELKLDEIKEERTIEMYYEYDFFDCIAKIEVTNIEYEKGTHELPPSVTAKENIYINISYND